MSKPLLDEAEARLAPHLLALTRDRWLQGTVALLAALSAVAWWSDGALRPGLLSTWVQALPQVLLGGVVFTALWHRLDNLRQREERLFWQDVATSSGALLAVAVLQLGGELPYMAVVSDLFYIAFFVVFVLALERRPHRHHPWRPSTLDRNLSWPALLVFVACLFLYLVIQPLYFEAYQPRMASYWLAWLLDGYLAIRLALAATKTSSWRWQNLYTVLCLAMVVAVADDVWRIAAELQWVHPTAAGLRLGHSLPLLLLLLAARLRHRRFPADAMIEEERVDAGISSPAGQGLIFVLALPILHFSYQGLVDNELAADVPEAHQELLLLIASLILGALAYVQYQRLRQTMDSLRRDRSRFEEDLLESEQDLRLMVEQKQAAETQSTFERNFVEIFQRNPDAIAICSLADSEILEVNDAFANLFGLSRQEMMGRTPGDLGLLAPDHDLEPLQSKLQRQDAVREHRVLCRQPHGEPFEAVMSAKRVEIAGHASMLIVTAPQDAETSAAVPSRSVVRDWLAEAVDAAWVVDDEACVTYWNQAAETLLGWTEQQALGQPIDHLLAIDDHHSTLAAVDSEGHWSGNLQVTRGTNRSPLTVQCRYLRLSRPQSSDVLRLAICRAVDDGGATAA